jgi:hypothetical protein
MRCVFLIPRETAVNPVNAEITGNVAGDGNSERLNRAFFWILLGGVL